jgi:hypothetical protein
MAWVFAQRIARARPRKMAVANAGKGRRPKNQINKAPTALYLFFNPID